MSGAWRSFVRSALRRRRFEQEMAAEIEDHISSRAEELISRGAAPQDALRQARREFGAIENIKDECRDSKWLQIPDAVARDLGFGLRMLCKSPAFTATAIATLALCIGANTMIFSVVDALLFRPLPYPESGRLAMIAQLARAPGGEEDDTSVDGGTWEYLHPRARTLDLALFGPVTGVNVAPPGGPARYVSQARISAGYFRVLGVAPLMGREIQPQEDVTGGPAVALLSYSLWTRLFGSDAAIVGKKITLRGEPYTVIGVMPRGFVSAPAAELWTPLRPSTTGEGGGDNYGLIARLRPGYRLQDADAELASLGVPYFAAMKLRPGISLRWHLIPVQSGLYDQLRTPLLLLWAAVGLVLLIGCVNLAGLILARAGTRRHEIATRLAMGGSRAAIVRQLLTESLLIACAGAAGGLVLGYGAMLSCRRLLISALFTDTFTGGPIHPIAMSGRVLAATAAAALVTVLLFGLYPAFEMARADLLSGLAPSGRTLSRRRTRSRSVLMVCEVALGMVLLVSAGLVLRTLMYVTNLNPGYDGHNILTASLSLRDARYATASSINRLFDESLARIRAYPGVEAAGVGLSLPYERALNIGARVVDGPHPMPQDAITLLTYVTPGYLEALQTKLLLGRTFDDRDRAAGHEVAIVNEAYVRRYIRDPQPLGRHIAFGRNDVAEIVGVMGDVQQQATGLGNFGPIAPVPGILVPAAQFSDSAFQTVHVWFNPKWVVRAAGRPADVARAMRQAVLSVDPQIAFVEFRGMDEVRGAAFGLERLETVLLGSLAALALMLAAVGVFGLIAHSVTERTREFGIRLALGSSIGRAIASAVRPGVALAAAGIATGWVVSLTAGKLIKALIWGVRPEDPVTFGVVAVVLLTAAALAALFPALRIARIDPARTLREE